MDRRSRLPLLLAGLLIACSGGPATPTPTEIPDTDHDGSPDVYDCAPEDPSIHPEAPETGSEDPQITAGDGVDNDCDDTIDEGTDAFDDDGDGYSEDATVGGAPDCDDGDSALYPGATEIPYDGIDQDCDGFDLDDVDGDGYIGLGADGDDCDDQDPSVYPGAPEDGGGTPPNYGDDKDNDCDDAIDEGMLDTDDDLDGVTEIDGDCDDADPQRYPGHEEVPYDGIDQDCDDEDLTDVDRDGFDSDQVEGGTDCDDTDDTVHLGADELCDGIDNDCDARIPEDEVPTTWYTDSDGDGFGVDDSATIALVCDPPPSGVTTGGDCDDEDGAVNPDAAEVCDGVDNDCDPGTDELEGPTFYPDEDDDGLGSDDSEGQAASICSPAPEGWVEIQGDCDDADPEVNDALAERCDGKDNDCDPATVEGPDLDGDGDGSPVCDDQGATFDCDDGDAATGPGRPDWLDDGQDNDCDGQVDNPTVASTLHPALFGSEVGALLGRSLAGGLDFDGDGLDDLVIGAPNQDEGGDADAGRAWLWYGAAQPPMSQEISAALSSIRGLSSSDNAGISVDLCPDLNGDDVADLVVGVYRDPTGGFNRGAAYVFFGGGEPLGSPVMVDTADVALVNESSNRSFGLNVRGIGDLNGDGFGDLASVAGGGRLAIYLGSASWAPVRDDDSGDGDDQPGPDLLLTGTVAGSDGGTEVSISSGDLNGDGITDLVVGDSGAASRKGRVYILWGRTDVTAASGDIADAADVTITGDESGDELGGAVDASGDLTGDGVVDLVASAPAAAAKVPTDPGIAGRIFLFQGGAGALEGVSGPADAMVSFGGNANSQRAGKTLRSVPDITGDGVGDLVIHGPGSDFAGTTWIVSGQPSWEASTRDHPLQDVAVLILTGSPGDQLGQAMAPLGTLLGTRSGLAVSASSSDVPTEDRGQVYLIEGRRQGPGEGPGLPAAGRRMP